MRTSGKSQGPSGYLHEAGALLLEPRFYNSTKSDGNRTDMDRCEWFCA